MTARSLLMLSLPPITQSTSTSDTCLFLRAAIGSLDIMIRITVYCIIWPLGSAGGFQVIVAVKGVIADSGTSGG